MVTLTSEASIQHYYQIFGSEGFGVGRKASTMKTGCGTGTGGCGSVTSPRRRTMGLAEQRQVAV